MAQAIPLKVAPRDVREELHKRLERAPDDHAEAILSAFELLQEMHNQGVLDIARGVLSTRDEILGTLARDASTPEGLRAIRNLLYLWRIVGSIEPERFQSILEAIPEGIAQASSKPEKPVTLFGLWRRLTDQDSLRALSAAVDFLHNLGHHLLAVENKASRGSVSS